jgi:hypothetical protein
LEVVAQSLVVGLESDDAAAAAEEAYLAEEPHMESLCADRFGVPFQVGKDDCCCERWWSVAVLPFFFVRDSVAAVE